MGSLPNMVRSMLVIGGLMLVIIFMVPRVNSVSGPDVDISRVATPIVKEYGWPIEAPAGAAQGLAATSARYVRTTEKVRDDMLAGYQAPSGNYVAGRADHGRHRRRGSTTEVNRAPEGGTLEAGGRTWQKYVREAKTQNSLVAPGPGDLTTISHRRRHLRGVGAAHRAPHLTPYESPAT